LRRNCLEQEFASEAATAGLSQKARRLWHRLLTRVRSAHTGDFQGKRSTNKEICLISPAF
jgi:hypothetical protein